MARCVVLGGGGFIGANLCNRLHADGHQVTAVDSVFPTWRAPSAQVERHDLRHAGVVADAIKHAEWVFHLAADMGGVGYFHSDADWSASVTNGLITNNVVRAVRPGQRLFYASSACAYPVELMGSNPLDEHHIGYGTPDQLYGAEKLHGLRLCSKMPNARVGVLDTVYGPLQEHSGRRMKFPAAVATKALRARGTGTLELWGDGTQRRCMLYVDDAVEKIVRVMESDRYEGPVNIGADDAVACSTVARLCLEIAGVPDAEITYNPAEPSGVADRALDHGKFRRLYGDMPQTSLRDGFSRFMAWLERVG